LAGRLPPVPLCSGPPQLELAAAVEAGELGGWEVLAGLAAEALPSKEAGPAAAAAPRTELACEYMEERPGEVGIV
jgi:hypothetical protein